MMAYGFVATATADRAAIRAEVVALKPVRVYYVDAGRSDSTRKRGVSFKSLVTAMGRGTGTPELLEDSSTDHVIFKLAPGDYTGVSTTPRTKQWKFTEAEARSPISRPVPLGTQPPGTCFFCEGLLPFGLRTARFVTGCMAVICATFRPWSFRIAVSIIWGLRGPSTALTFQKRTKRRTGRHAKRPAHTGRMGGQCAFGPAQR